MKFDFLKDKKCWCFAAGIATAVVGKKIATSDKVRSMCVSGLAKGMKFQQEAKETLQNMLIRFFFNLCYYNSALCYILSNISSLVGICHFRNLCLNSRHDL